MSIGREDDLSSRERSLLIHCAALVIDPSLVVRSKNPDYYLIATKPNK